MGHTHVSKTSQTLKRHRFTVASEPIQRYDTAIATHDNT